CLLSPERYGLHIPQSSGWSVPNFLLPRPKGLLPNIFLMPRISTSTVANFLILRAAFHRQHRCPISPTWRGLNGRSIARCMHLTKGHSNFRSWRALPRKSNAASVSAHTLPSASCARISRSVTSGGPCSRELAGQWLPLMSPPDRCSCESGVVKPVLKLRVWKNRHGDFSGRFAAASHCSERSMRHPGSIL